MKLKHGKSNTRLFCIWRSMLTRCTNLHSKSFKYYGGKGVKICEEWQKNFENFYNWAMNNGYAENLTIDRIDNNGNYEPSNCHWITMKEQQRNKSNSRVITAFGESYSLSQWAQKTGLSKTTLKSRLDKLGWSAEKALTTDRRKYLKKVTKNV